MCDFNDDPSIIDELDNDNSSMEDIFDGVYNSINNINTLTNEEIKNKKGRRLKSVSYLSKAVHTKIIDDNIITKIKIRFSLSTMNLLNILYKDYCKVNNIKYLKSKPLLKRIHSSFAKKKYKESLIFMKNNTIKDLFNDILLGKFKKENKEYNKINISKLYEEGKAKDIIKIMNKKIIDMYNIYIGKKENHFSNIYSLDNDIQIISIKEEKEYIEKYKDISINLEDKLNIK